MRYYWKVDRYGIECVTIDEGSVEADSLVEAKNKVDAEVDTQDWGEWRESTIQLDNGQPTRLSDLKPPTPCFIRETSQFGKPHELTMWTSPSVKEQNV